MGKHHVFMSGESDLFPLTKGSSVAAATKWHAISRCCLREVTLAFVFEIIIFTFTSRLESGA